MTHLAALVTNYPRTVIGLVLLITTLLAFELRGIRPEVDLKDLIPSDHPYVSVDQEINDRFGVGLTAIIAIGPRSGTIFEPSILGKVERATRAIEALEGVIPSSVMSIASENTRAILDGPDGVYVGPLMGALPTTPEEIASLRAATASSPVASRNLVTRDLKGAMVLADFSSTVDSEALASDLEAIAAAERDEGTRVLVGGQPSALAALDSATRGILPLLGLALVLVGLVHYEAFRTPQGIVLPLLTALIAVIWSMGLARLLGFRVTPWTALTTILVLSVAAGHAVQMLKRYYECLAQSGDNKRAVVDALERVGPAMVTAGAVAAAGFGSLAWFGVQAVQDFGVIAACGIVSALVIEVTLIPSIRVLIDPRKTREIKGATRSHLLERLVSRITDLVSGRPATVVGVVTIGVLLTSLGVFWLRVDTAFRSWFDSDNQAIVSDREIRSHFIGTSTIRLLVETDDSEGLYEPEILRGVAKLQALLDADPDVSASLSIVDFVSAAHVAMAGLPVGSPAIPEGRELVSQYLLILGAESLSRVIAADGRSTVIYCLARTDSVEWAQSLFTRLREEGARVFPPSVKLRVAGGELAQAIANNETVVREKIKNILQVAAVIFLLSALVFRSWVGGLLVLAPLVCAAAVNIGVMGWAGSRLSFATATYTSMGVSLGADFAIYLLFRIREELRCGSLEKAVVESLRTAGQAIVFVASAIAAGYAALMTSDFALWRELGAYVGLMMIVSAACTTTLLPSLVLLFRPAFLSPSTESGA